MAEVISEEASNNGHATTELEGKVIKQVEVGNVICIWTSSFAVRYKYNETLARFTSAFSSAGSLKNLRGN